MPRMHNAVLRCVVLLLSLLLPLAAADAGDEADAQATVPQAVGDAQLRFEPGAVDLYLYKLDQSVVWTSAGDELRFDTHLGWTLKLRVLSSRGDRARLELTVIQIKGVHRGPGSEHRIDSRATDPLQRGEEDPLLGDYLALVGVPLQLELDCRNGAVLAVDGSEALVERLSARHPGPPGETSPLRERAAEVYSSERLADLWSQLFLVPGSQTALPGPVGERLERRWTGSDYQLALRADAPEEDLRVELATQPTPVELHLRGIEGSGAVVLKNGGLEHAHGSLAFELEGRAMTQSLRQQHELQWTLGKLGVGAALPATGDAEQAAPDDGTDTDEDDQPPVDE